MKVILIKYRKIVLGPDWTELKRLDGFIHNYTSIKAATVLDGLVKLLQIEVKEKYPNFPKEIVNDLSNNIMEISKILSDSSSDYDQLTDRQLYKFYNLLFSFYMFKFLYLKKKKLEEVKSMFGFPAIKRPFYNLYNN